MRRDSSVRGSRRAIIAEDMSILVKSSVSPFARTGTEGGECAHLTGLCSRPLPYAPSCRVTAVYRTFSLSAPTYHLPTYSVFMQFVVKG